MIFFRLLNKNWIRISIFYLRHNLCKGKKFFRIRFFLLLVAYELHFSNAGERVIEFYLLGFFSLIAVIYQFSLPM